MRLFTLLGVMVSVASCSLVLEDPRPYPEPPRLDAAMQPGDMAPPPVDMARTPRRDVAPVSRPMDATPAIDAMVTIDGDVVIPADGARDAATDAGADGLVPDAALNVDDAAPTDSGNDAGSPI